MKIRVKVTLVVFPIIIVSVVLVGVASYFSATTGITRLARELLDFKAEELERYAGGQWQLLVENELESAPEMVEATQLSVGNYAQGILRSDTEQVYAFDRDGQVVFETEPLELAEGEQQEIASIIEQDSGELITTTLGGVKRVARGFDFAPYDWFFLLTEHQDVFYQDIDRITSQTIVILSSTLLASILILFLFAATLTRPLRTVVTSMRRIIDSNDLDERVPVEYRDETGELAHTFNLMTEELGRAYQQIKSYALKAVVAQKKETKIRNIFQKYVPQDLIDRFYEHPEAMLVGENRELSVLFSDIRSFTTISEGMSPDALVQSLNEYFSVMVDIIMGRGGIIDKYIGDAIMAFFGAPVHHDDDAYQSLLAGLEMCRDLDTFNAAQREAGKPEFRIGVGITYGTVTVGNIGTEKKMDYTVIGDTVNLASRMEGLTKYYGQPLLCSETVHNFVDGRLPTRLIDTVAVKGKRKGVRIYTAALELSDTVHAAWNTHNTAMERFYARDFEAASDAFRNVLTQLGDDPVAKTMLERCERYAADPPPSDWSGIEIMETK